MPASSDAAGSAVKILAESKQGYRMRMQNQADAESEQGHRMRMQNEADRVRMQNQADATLHAASPLRPTRDVAKASAVTNSQLCLAVAVPASQER